MYSTLEERNIYAGENVFYRYGHKAQEKVEACLTKHNGFYSIPVNGGAYYAIGTSDGKYGEYAKMNGVCFSVNKAGYAYAKAGTEKGDAFIAALNAMIESMKESNEARLAARDGDDDDEDEDEVRTSESKSESEDTAPADATGLKYEVTYENRLTGGHRIVGEYTDVLEADAAAKKTAEMDDAEFVYIHVYDENGEHIGAICEKKGNTPHADV